MHSNMHTFSPNISVLNIFQAFTLFYYLYRQCLFLQFNAGFKNRCEYIIIGYHEQAKTYALISLVSID